ncbi:MAG: hypothetical protein AB8G22_05235 [Saprospiraceae bacterium]
MDIYSKVSQSIGEDEIELALRQILAGIDSKESVYYYQYVMLKSQFVATSRKSNMGLISNEQFDIAMSSIRTSLLQLAKEIADAPKTDSTKAGIQIHPLEQLEKFLNSKKAILVTALFCILYLATIYVKWHDLASFVKLIIPFASFGIGIGIIISALPIINPTKFAYKTTMYVPIICFGIELVFHFLITPLFAGGGDISAKHQISFFVISALFFIFGGYLLGLFTVGGCYIGLFLKDFYSNLLSLNTSQSLETKEMIALQEIKRNRIANGFNIIIGVLVILLIGFMV